MSKLKLTTQVLAGLIAVFALLLIVDFAGIAAMRRQQTLAAEAESQNQKRESVTTLFLGLEKQGEGVRGFMLNGSAEMLARDEEGRLEFALAMRKLQLTATTAEMRALLANIDSVFLSYRSECDQLKRLASEGKLPDALSLMSSTNFVQVRASILQSLSELDRRTRQQKQESLKQLAIEQRRSQLVSIFFLIAAFVFGSLIARTVILAVRLKTDMLCVMIRRMANWELDFPDPEVSGSDDISHAMVLLTEMKHGFRKLLQGWVTHAGILKPENLSNLSEVRMESHLSKTENSVTRFGKNAPSPLLQP
jgi:CHASE3 domain sensor protein